MLKEVVVIVWVEERLDSICTLECSNGNVLCGIRKKLWKTAFCTRKSILISEASTNGIQAKVLMMLEEVVVIVWVEERLDSIWTLECSNRNVLCGIRKRLWTTAFCTRKSILISEASTNGIEAKVSTMLEEVVVIVWVEERLDSIWILGVGMETYFAEFAKNYEQQPFATGNQSTFLRLLQVVFKRKFQRY